MTVKHPDTEYYFIMGADSLFAFETWHEPQKICQNCVDRCGGTRSCIGRTF